MPTSRNARGVDIIAYNYDCSKTISIQVKSLSKKAPVPLGKTIEKVMGDFWVIVNNLSTEEPVAYILKPKEVIREADRKEKEGRVSYWLQPRSYMLEKYCESWDRIGDAIV